MKSNVLNLLFCAFSFLCIGVLQAQPNIILIMADDVSAREFSCYGHPNHRTPALDRLAEAGVVFKTCWATPICSPSRAEIMTGRYGFRTEWFHNQMKPKDEPLSADNTIFSQFLQRAGYATAVCGKWQLPGTYEEHGFDEHCIWTTPAWEGFEGPVEGEDLRGKPGTFITRTARYWHPSIVRNGKGLPTTASDYGPDLFVDFLLDFARRHTDRPFLVYYPMCLPHMSWDFEAEKAGYLPVPQLDDQGNKTGARRPGSLQSNVEYIDHLISRIIEGLTDMGEVDQTVLLFTGDNGTAGYGKGQVVMERGQRVPMIVYGPGTVRPQGAINALMDFSDVLPTICDMAGAGIPEGYVVDGRSMVPVLKGEKEHLRNWIFSYYADYRMLRDERWLLDGNDRLYDTGGKRNERNYIDVTGSEDPEVVRAKQRFEAILTELPAPTTRQQDRLRFETQGHTAPAKDH